MVKKYLLAIGIADLLCLAALVSIVMLVDPYKASVLILITFFTTLGLFLLGSYFLIGYAISVKLTNNEVIYAQIPKILRQGLFFSLFWVGLLLLQLFGVLRWWDGLIWALILVMLEAYFHTKKSNLSS
jgi:hypothetical protein